MHILLTGATGLIGRALGTALLKAGHRLSALVRDPVAARRRLPYPATLHPWEHTQAVPAQALAGVEAVIHLAGEPIAEQRWSTAHKALLRDSRLLGTRALVQAVRAQGPGVRVFVHGSATGYWGDRGDAVVDAHSIKGGGFLSDLVADWEDALQPLTAPATAPGGQVPRVAVVRTGVVLAREGGALASLLPLLRLGAAGPLGAGTQWFPWIHLDDIVALLIHALDQPVSGVLEGVAPEPVTNRQFTQSLARALAVRVAPTVPALAIQAAWGERAALMLASTRVQARATAASGFVWRHPALDAAVEDLLLPLRDGIHLRQWAQWLPQPVDRIWPFFCDPLNLEAITPNFLHFKVLGPLDNAIAAGSRIDYRLQLAGVPLNWRTRIERWDPPHAFVDTQERGPYRLWEHTHDFLPLAGGTLMRDTVRWQLPLGWPGLATAGAAVDAAVQRIFAYRAQAIDERFGAPPMA